MKSSYVSALELAPHCKIDMAMIDVEAGEFGYGGKVVAGPVNLAVHPREIVAIVGPSGCGKTTVLKTISGEVPLIRGAIRLEGQGQERSWLVRNLSRTLQNFPLLHWLTVEQNLQLAATMKGVHALDVDRVLSEFSALHLTKRYPNTLSGGERCRASLAQAAVTGPKVLLLDEPFTGLDLHVKEEIAQRLFSFAESHGTSIVFVTHDLYDAREYAKRVMVLNGSKPSTVSAVVDPGDHNAVNQIRAAMKRGEAQ